MELGNRLWRWLESVIDAIAEASPPYRWVEGRLLSKDTDQEGNFYLSVDNQKVQVDGLTFKRLVVGEELKVRCTRGMRAISIDRLMSRGGPGK